MGIMNSCSSDVNLTDPNNQFSIDQNDLTDNFMDYAPTECAKYFTSGQVTRMHTAIEGPRQSLLISSGCLPPCVDPPSYVLDISDDTLLIGEELVIIPVGSGIHNDSYWKLGNEIFLGSELHWIADTTGTLSFIFYPFHSDPTCIRLDTIVIRVDCYLQPQLSISDLTPDVGDTLFFTSPGSIEENLIWYIDGELAGQGDSLVWPILTEGSYQVKIEFCDGTCCGNAVEYIQAGECPSGLEGSLWMFARDGITLDFLQVPRKRPCLSHNQPLLMRQAQLYVIKMETSFLYQRAIYLGSESHQFNTSWTHDLRKTKRKSFINEYYVLARSGQTLFVLHHL